LVLQANELRYQAHLKEQEAIKMIEFLCKREQCQICLSIAECSRQSRKKIKTLLYKKRLKKAIAISLACIG
jgi:hypothetical protein